MRRNMAGLLFLLLLLGGSAGSPAAADVPRPQRIVSLNQCTDQLLLLLVPPERVASVSFVSKQPQWEPPERKAVLDRIPSNRGTAEEALNLRPDLVVTTEYTGTQAVQLLRRLGYRVEEFKTEANFADIRANIRKMGALTGEQAKAEELVAAFEAHLAAIKARAKPNAGVFADVGVNGWMSGEGTLMAEIANAAGYRTLGQALGVSGFTNLSLEQIIAAQPSVVAISNAWTRPPSEATNALKHPAFRQLARTATFIDIPDRLTVCGLPSVLDAADLLEQAKPAQHAS